MTEENKNSARNFLAIVLLLICCSAFFLSALSNPDSAFVGVLLGKGDAEGTMWWNWTVKENLLSGRWPAEASSIFYPYGVKLALFYGSPLNSLLYFPFNALISLPFSNTVYCIILLFADAIFAFIYFNRQTKSPVISLFIAAIWALAPMKFMEYGDGHLPQIPVCFIPLIFLGLELMNTRPSVQSCLAASLFLVLDACGYYQHAFAVLFIFIFFFTWGLITRIREKNGLAKFIAGYLCAAAAVIVGAWIFYKPLISNSLSLLPETGFVYPDSLPAAAIDLLRLPGGVFFEKTSLVSVDFHGSFAQHAILVYSALAAMLVVTAILLKPRKTWPYVLMSLFFVVLLLAPFINRPDTFWPYAHFAACAAIAWGFGKDKLERGAAVKNASKVWLIVICFIMVSLSILYVHERPFISKFNKSPVIDSLRDSPGKAFLPLPSGPLDDYFLPAVVLSGKALVGGRGRDPGYLIPRKWEELSSKNKTLASLKEWTPHNPDRFIDMGGVKELISIGVDRALLDKQALLQYFENPFLPPGDENEFGPMINEVMEKFGDPIIEDRRFVLFSLPRIQFMKKTDISTVEAIAQQ